MKPNCKNCSSFVKIQKHHKEKYKIPYDGICYRFPHSAEVYEDYFCREFSLRENEIHDPLYTKEEIYKILDVIRLNILEICLIDRSFDKVMDFLRDENGMEDIIKSYK